MRLERRARSRRSNFCVLVLADAAFNRSEKFDGAHGLHPNWAVYIAVERLNQSIDERDYPARDFWAQAVHAIHEYQRLGHGSNARAAGDPGAVPAKKKR